MSCCTPCITQPELAQPDPCKHVNYVLGMLLGKADFDQEFAYHDGRSRAILRELIGYGTVRGLPLRFDPKGPNGPRLVVGPGLAVTPGGAIACVSADQCADLNPWLHSQRDELVKRVASPPDLLPVYVVLGYRTRLTDRRPIPGEPCRTDDDLAAETRIADDFCLELRFEPPPQREEDALRQFVALLRGAIDDGASPAPQLADFLDALRDAMTPASPPLSVSPPNGIPRIPRDRCEDYLREALHLWITELRPQSMLRTGCCGSRGEAPASDPGLLLARADLPLVHVGSDWAISDLVDAEVDLATRPRLLHLRMLQELVDPCCCAPAKELVQPIVSPPVAVPLAALSVRSETEFGLVADVGVLDDYARADHTHGTPDVNGDLDLVGSPAEMRVERLQGIDLVATGAGADEVLTFRNGGWRPAPVPPPVIPPLVLPALGRDLSGTLDNAEVVGLRGVGLPALLPGAGGYLEFDGANWVLSTPAAAGQFVGRSTADPYSIVAAGTFGFTFDRTVTGSSISVLQQYNKLEVGPDHASIAITGPGQDVRIGWMFTYPGLKVVKPQEMRLIFKLMPGFAKPPPLAKPFPRFNLYFGGLRSVTGQPCFAVLIDRLTDSPIEEGILMIEVSDFRGMP